MNCNRLQNTSESSTQVNVDSISIKVALVEDSPAERQALSFLIQASSGFKFLGAFASGEEALAQLPCLAPDVVLMDIQLPGISGIECIRQLKDFLPSTRIMMLTVFEDHDRILSRVFELKHDRCHLEP